MTAETRFHRPASLDEALDLLAEHPRSAVLAGGTDLMPALNSGRRHRPERLLSLRSVEGLAGISTEDPALLRIGATATHAQLCSHPDVQRFASALADVAAQIGSPATRAWGTLGGSVANGSRSMDAAPALVALDAAVELRSVEGGARTAPVADFLLQSPVTRLRAGELIVGFSIPILPESRSGWVKLGVRQRLDVATVSAAVALRVQGEQLESAAVAVGGLWPAARRVGTLEDRVRGASISEAVAACRAVTSDLDEVTSDRRAPDDYRRQVAGTVLARAFERAWQRTGRPDDHA